MVSLPYGDEFVENLISHCVEDRDAETLDGNETVKTAIISTEMLTEWKTFHQLLVKKTWDTTASGMKELVPMIAQGHVFYACDCLHQLINSSLYRFSGEKLLTGKDDQDSIAEISN